MYIEKWTRELYNASVVGDATDEMNPDTFNYVGTFRGVLVPRRDIHTCTDPKVVGRR